jgi:hypothetical protein
MLRHPTRLGLLALALIFASAPAHANNVTVPSNNYTRIHYVGKWIDQDNGGHQLNGDLSDSLTFTFTG